MIPANYKGSTVILGGTRQQPAAPRGPPCSRVMPTWKGEFQPAESGETRPGEVSSRLVNRLPRDFGVTLRF